MKSLNFKLFKVISNFLARLCQAKVNVFTHVVAFAVWAEYFWLREFRCITNVFLGWKVTP